MVLIFKIGLKVTGGKMTEAGHLGAFITKVKKGSIADSVGHLRAGDEVVEWNGRNLRGLTFDEVYDIIFESKQEPQVELIVQRPISSGELPADIPEHPDMEPVATNPATKQRKTTLTRLKRPSVTITSPGSPGTTRPRPHSPLMCGKIQVKMFYDTRSYQLIVTVIGAMNLAPRDNGQPRNPYCKLYLLPDRSEKSKRRTKTVAGTLEPKWNQTFIYSPMKRSDLESSSLEITVYDYDRIGSGEYVGEAIIDLSGAEVYQDEPQWHMLRHHDDTSSSITSASREGYRRNDGYSKDHLSPPGSVARLSDSDMSEFDIEDNLSSITGQPNVEAANEDDHRSVSSLASSCSPPPPPQPPAPPDDDLLDADPSLSSPVHHCPPPRLLPDSPVLEGARRLPQTPGNASQVDYDQMKGHSNYSSSDTLTLTAEQSARKSRSPTTTAHADEPQQRAMRSRSRSPGRQRIAAELGRPLSPNERDNITREALASSSRSQGMSSGGTRPNSAASGGSTPVMKKRQLPQIPVQQQIASRDRVTQDLEERTRAMKMRFNQYKNSSSQPASDSEASYKPRSRDQEKVNRNLPSSVIRDRMDRSYDRYRDPERHRKRRGRAEFSPEVVSDDALQSDASETSDMSEISKISTISLRSTQSERPHRKLSEFASKMESRAGGNVHKAPKPQPSPTLNRSLSNSDVGTYEKTDGSISDSAISLSVTEGRKRRPSLGYKVKALVGLSRKSNSTSQLTGGIGRGTGKKGKAAFVRSEEVGAAAEMRRQPSKDSTDGSMGSISSDSSEKAMWLPSGMRIGPEGQFGDFIEGLGPSQLVGRQVLGSPCLGEIQMGLAERQGQLEVEVIRARGLMAKAGAKILPAPYVKVYLMDGKDCIEKQKTTIARRTLDPLYQKQLFFTENYTAKVLQVTVWGDYGRMERKVFMGVAQILLDDLDLSNLVIGWYKLFTSSSLVNAHAAGSTGGAASAPGGAAPTSSSASGTVRRNSGSSLESAYQSSSTRS
ncbi:hypothetical protein CAPTEDRAFT_224324 [Capitella teleta]|uniref:Regulating synaptic membrane exocytosis protein 2 n=1 Tax=Capitella teleta TaxID=283909 RepID=R7VC62_CAPTE|nr:hypothetical protein CAPTEDRAFT_224324 [Capitella teleta]|eukprot:ELU13906.1 hypothetical protein CAPTEDRAFT_224324 [Capitella teleta]